MQHVRAARLCARGARAWLELHGLSVEEFIFTGISADRIEATGDHLGLAVAAVAREQAARDG
jgi:hypothetical protein